MNFNHEELMLMMLYNTGTRMGLIHELRLMQCYLMPDETALRELSEGVIEKLKLLTDAEFAELEFLWAAYIRSFTMPFGVVY